ncbi:TonB-dependent siderophore receptor [Chitinibacter bivalviorum]|nr:TonB-dependent siderophore receptor [Chitinibacter bivalviorum]
MNLAVALTLSATTPVLTHAAEVTLNQVEVSANATQQPSEKTGLYRVSSSNSATLLDLPLSETPQTVSVVTRAQMDDFKLDNIDEVLGNTTGVTVEKAETERTYYTARGFDITNFKVDGVGVPFTSGHQMGDMDTAIYDRIDVVLGANGLTSSTGNPSATIDFVRKRPTPEFEASAGVLYGSWNTRRIDADISSPLNSEGTIAARVVIARQEGDSYLDRYEPAKTVFYGVIEAYLSYQTVLTMGYSYQKNDADGAMWGALPLLHSNGTPTDYAVNTNTAADWSYWDSQDQRVFAELNHTFSNNWQWKTTLGYNQLKSDGALFYVYGNPDQHTGEGLFSYPSLYNSNNRQALMDSNLSGQFALAGREHEFIVGASASRSTLSDISHYGQGIGTSLTPSGAFDGSYPMPSFDASTDGSDYTDVRKSIYAATRLHLADDLKLLLGANYTYSDSSGTAYGVNHQSNAHATTPYIGLVYDLSQNLSLYGSYTEIFNPQYKTDASGTVLEPVEGKSYELGIKGDFFAQKLNASAAVFKVEQNNSAELAGYIGSQAYYKGIDAASQGLEMQLAGELADGWQASMGATALSIKNELGATVKTYVPKQTVRISTTYQLPQLKALKIGASVNWQSQTSYHSADGNFTQPSYAILNLMARYDVNKQLSVTANLNNVTNQKYISSLYWAPQAFYGAPINGSISVNWKY